MEEQTERSRVRAWNLHFLKQKWLVDRIDQATEAAARSLRVAEVIKLLERIGQSRQQ